MAIPTPHIEVNNLNTIADTVIMPGDPLRAKFIADNFLSNVKLFNSVRNMLGFTGEYKNKTVSVMGSGMGMPSIGIYSYELYHFYDVKSIIRVGSAGSYDANVKLYDIVLTKQAWSETSYAKTQSGYSLPTVEPTVELNTAITAAANRLNIPIKEASVHSSDVFYRQNSDEYKNIRQEHGCVCVEMEAFALFANAKLLNKKAACVLTISDSFITHESALSQERQNCFGNMIKIVLESL